MSRTKRILILLGILAVLAILISDAFAGGLDVGKWWPFDSNQSRQSAQSQQSQSVGSGAAATADEGYSQGDAAIAELFETKAQSTMVKGSGHVLRLLSDDNDGSRHQRFIIELASGHTLLIAHNIDLAPRVEPLTVGDTVTFFGEYEYSEEGGTVHWTHKDPQKQHVAGYIEVNGKRFQ